MSVVRWANENYDARSMHRRMMATVIVTFVEWALSALLALVGLVALHLVFEWAGIEVGTQTFNLVWIALTVLVLSRVWGWAGRPERAG